MTNRARSRATRARHCSVLLNVPNYDYNWQINYIYRQPKLLPAGTRVEILAVFDNSQATADKYPEVNVNRAVRYGGPSTDEMMNPFLAWTYIDPEQAREYRTSGRIISSRP